MNDQMRMTFGTLTTAHESGSMAWATERPFQAWASRMWLKSLLVRVQRVLAIAAAFHSPNRLSCVTDVHRGFMR
jgi:hypothetical protein